MRGEVETVNLPGPAATKAALASAQVRARRKASANAVGFLPRELACARGPVAARAHAKRAALSKHQALSQRFLNLSRTRFNVSRM